MALHPTLWPVFWRTISSLKGQSNDKGGSAFSTLGKTGYKYELHNIYTLVQSLNLHNNLLQFLHGSFVDVEAILSKLIYKIQKIIKLYLQYILLKGQCHENSF